MFIPESQPSKGSSSYGAISSPLGETNTAQEELDSDQERPASETELRDEERSLLRDNSVSPRITSNRKSRAFRDIISQLGQYLSVRVNPRRVVEDAESSFGTADVVGDITIAPPGPLTNGERYHVTPGSLKDLGKQAEEAAAGGKIQTTWQCEAKLLGKYSQPLIATFLLQYSLTVASKPVFLTLIYD